MGIGKRIWRLIGRKLHKHCPDLFNVSISFDNISIGDNCSNNTFEVTCSEEVFQKIVKANIKTIKIGEK